jgi:transposase
MTGESLRAALAESLNIYVSKLPVPRTLMIELDNGPDIQSHRTQFIKRITQLADKTGLRIELVYYPPYHSKYNPIERCWSALERHWNGSLLTTIETAIQWASTMTWRQIQPIVWALDCQYERGVKLTKNQMKQWSDRLQRLLGLECWSVHIEPLAATKS